jgi:hypothetical protein
VDRHEISDGGELGDGRGTCEKQWHETSAPSAGPPGDLGVSSFDGGGEFGQRAPTAVAFV